MNEKFPLLDKFVWYLNERWSIHQKRLKGLPPPWTNDYALQKYRFCQVRREDDRVTRWIHENWLRPHADDSNLWHAMYIARIYNRPKTLAAVGWPEPWGAKRTVVMGRVRKWQLSGNTTFTAAYTLHCCEHVAGVECTMTEYYARIFDALWENRKFFQPRPSDKLQTVHNRLVTQRGIAGFMAAQIVADAKWGGMLRDAPDWDTFTISGPGSLRGLNRLCGRELNQRWREIEWHAALLDARKIILPLLPKPLRSLDAQNIEHGLCEFDKWSRVAEGRRPKLMYTKIQPNYFKEFTK